MANPRAVILQCVLKLTPKSQSFQISMTLKSISVAALLMAAGLSLIHI